MTGCVKPGLLRRTMKKKHKEILIDIFIAFSTGIVMGMLLIAVTLGNKQNSEYNQRVRTLNWLAKEYAKVRNANDILANQNDYFRAYSFFYVMNTLVEKSVEKKIPINIVLALIQIESNFNPDIISTTGDHGLFQFNMETWEKELKIDKQKAYEPEYNIEIGLTILQRFYKAAGTWPMALAMYNAGMNPQISKHPEKLQRSIFK
jgi:soluble lytic murein transglycosylase-like protein